MPIHKSAYAFRMEGKPVSCAPFGNGHINSTFMITTAKARSYVLQHINKNVFLDPVALTENAAGVTEHIRSKGGNALHFQKTEDGRNIYCDETGEYWRAAGWYVNKSILEKVGWTPEQIKTIDKSRLDEYIGKEVVMGVRPECIHDEPMYLSSMPESVIETDVEVTELMGAEIYLYLNIGRSEEGDNKVKIVNDGTNLIARVSSRSTSRAGDTIKVAFDTSRIHIFDKDTERCICH